VSEQWQSPYQLWHVSYPDGQWRRITNDLSSYVCVSAAAGSTLLVSVQRDRRSDLWVAPGRAAGPAKKIGSVRIPGEFTWTPDGRVVYVSAASSTSDLWIMRPDGSGARQLTNAGINYRPRTSPDGRYLLFTRSGSDNIRRIWRMDMDGNNLRQITHGSWDIMEDCSPDSKWVVYTSPPHGSMWKVSIEGGAPEALADSAAWGVVSPDGTQIAYMENQRSGPLRFRIALMSFTGGKPTRFLDIGKGAIGPLRWTPDSKALTYVKDVDEVSNIWSQPVAGGPPKRMTDFTSERIFWYDWSHDGKQLACARGIETGDVVLLRDVK
jgi:Tol biopolymer transport system component